MQFTSWKQLRTTVPLVSASLLFLLFAITIIYCFHAVLTVSNFTMSDSTIGLTRAWFHANIMHTDNQQQNEWIERNSSWAALLIGTPCMTPITSELDNGLYSPDDYVSDAITEPTVWWFRLGTARWQGMESPTADRCRMRTIMMTLSVDGFVRQASMHSQSLNQLTLMTLMMNALAG